MFHVKFCSTISYTFSSCFSSSPSLLTAPPAIIGNIELVTLANVVVEEKAEILMKINTKVIISISMLIRNEITKSLTESPTISIDSYITNCLSSFKHFKNSANSKLPDLSISTFENICSCLV